MSAAVSISTRRPYGVSRVCRVWGVARSGVYRRRMAEAAPAPRRRPGPAGMMPDAALVEAIRRVLIESPFHGEGYRKNWGRLRHADLRASKERVGRPRGPRHHDGTIVPDGTDAMWGTDMTRAMTTEHGQVAVFIAVDHRSVECTGIHTAPRASRYEVLEPIRQGAVERFKAVGEDMAADLSIRHDHGSQRIARNFQHEVTLARRGLVSGLCPRAPGRG